MTTARSPPGIASTERAFVLPIYLWVCALGAIALAPACAPPPSGFCGEGEGEGGLFGPTLDGPAAPADFGTLPLNGVLHVAARNFGVPVDATLRTGGIDSTERPVDIDVVAPVLRVRLDDLVADIAYVATLRMDPAEAPTGAQTVRDLNFTTTDFIDDTAPVFNGEATVEVARTANDVECSGAGTLVNILAPEILDDSGVAGVMVLAVDDSDGIADILVGFHVGSGNLVHTREVGSTGTIELIAVDFAGNESAPLPVDVTAPTEAGCSASAGSPSLAAVALLQQLRRSRRRTLSNHAAARPR